MCVHVRAGLVACAGFVVFSFFIHVVVLCIVNIDSMCVFVLLSTPSNKVRYDKYLK